MPSGQRSCAGDAGKHQVRNCLDHGGPLGVHMLAGRGYGVALNPDVARSANVLGANVMAWLYSMLGQGAAIAVNGQITRIDPPAHFSQDVLQALSVKLAFAAGMAQQVCLCTAHYQDGSTGYILAIIDAQAEAEAAFVQAVDEVVRFSASELTLDLVFVKANTDVALRFLRTGICIELPRIKPNATVNAPGSDPNCPPILR